MDAATRRLVMSIPFLGIKPALHDPVTHHPTLSLLQLLGFLKVLSTFALGEMQFLNALIPDTHVAYFLTSFLSLLNVSYPVRTDLAPVENCTLTS